MTVASNVSSRMEYVGNAAPTTLSGDLSASGTSFNLTDPTAYPQGIIGKFVLVVNKGGQTEEKILCDTRTGSQINADPAGRGYDGTLPQTHSAGESVQVCWPATAADDDNRHNNSTSGVHGVAGNVVGDTDTQTLTNKTIDGTKNTLRNVPYTALTGVPAATPVALLAVKFDPITNYAVTPAGAAVDSAVLGMTFTVPTSGKVLLRASCGMLYGNDGFYQQFWWQNHANGGMVGVKVKVTANAASSIGYNHPSVAQLVTGLTPGTSITVDLWAGTTGGTEGATLDNICVEAWTA